MTEYDLNDEANVNFLNEEYGLPEGFIASLPEDEKSALDCAINMFVQVQRDEGIREWTWRVGDLLGGLSSEIEYISRDYTEIFFHFDDDMENAEDALGDIERTKNLIKKLLPIYEDQLMEELKWHKEIVSEADQITVEKLVENSKKQQTIYKEWEKERNAA